MQGQKRTPSQWFALLLLSLATAYMGCSTGVDNSSLNLLDAQGKHSTPNWVSTMPGASSVHPALALPDGSRCMECHGSDLKGGIAKVSCFTTACHHGTRPDWVQVPGQSQRHGTSAKKAPGNSGFVSCRICHGVDFSGGGANVSCTNTDADCHGIGVKSPHPARPWLGGVPGGKTHDNTAPQNADVCINCHAGGANTNPPHPPPTPAPAGTLPGCFNSTLCHALPTTHATGSVWLDPNVGGSGFHGTAAKANLLYCQLCHGTQGTIAFSGGHASTACSVCHTASKAHPTDWQGVRPIGTASISHRTSGNRTDACGICHKVDGPGSNPNNAAAPSCFSASFSNALGQARFCHSNGPGQPDHAVPFYTHPATDNTLFGVRCSNCHNVQTGQGQTPLGPDCRICHLAGDPLDAVYANCASCHGNPPNGSAFPNIGGAHAKHLALNNDAVLADVPTACANRELAIPDESAQFDVEIAPGDEDDYREAHRRARKLANALGALGAKKGDRVGTLAWNGFRHLEAFYGISGMGAVMHTVNPRLFADQIAYIVNHAEDRLMLADTTFVPLLEKLAPKLASIERYVLLIDACHMP